MVSVQMEDNSPSPQPTTPTPQHVGREFVRQYYTLLAEAPRYVHRFYSNESIFVHGTDTEEVVGQTAIANKIKDLNFKECRTRIRALDAHETLGKGVVVLVVGELSVNQAPMRRFVQTFVLAPQSEKKYYVHNDIFRYEDELFSENLPQENGAPADPDAVATGVDYHRLRSETPSDQVTVNNGNVQVHHPEDAQHARYNSQSPVQPQTISTTIPNQPLPPQTVSMPYSTIPGTMSIGAPHIGQPPLPDGCAPYSVSGDAGFGSAATAGGPPLVALPPTNPCSQTPLLHVSQPHSTGQVSSAPPPPAPVTDPSLPLAQPPPPPEPTVETGSISIPDQPPRPPSTDKMSPAPSEDREEPADSATAGSSWASVAATKSYRSPQQGPQQQHGPGISASQISPQASAPHHAGQAYSDLANRPNQHQPYRQTQQPRPHRPNNVFSAPVSQDVRASPAPSGYQPNHPGASGNSRADPASAGSELPLNQQVFVNHLPLDTSDIELKALLENNGFGGIVDTKVRKNAGPNGPKCFAFVTFDSAETAHSAITKKRLTLRGQDISIDIKHEKNSSGGNFQRHYPGSGGAITAGGLGRGGANSRGGARGSGPPNRPMAPGGGPPAYFGQGGGGGGRHQAGRTIYSNTGRGGGGPHPQ